MCGIFGAVFSNKSKIREKDINKIIDFLSLFSETRGRDSSGFAFVNSVSKDINVLKSNQKVSSLIRSKKFQNLEDSLLKSFKISGQLSFIGHSRLVTHGSHLNQFNNQPVVKGNVITVHNGIIVNYKKLWDNNNDISQKYQIDTEVFNSLLDYYMADNSFIDAFKLSLSNIKGTVSLAVYHKFNNFLTLYTNNRSLYLLTNNSGISIFASEKFTLESLQLSSYMQFDDFKIISLDKNKIITVDFSESLIKSHSTTEFENTVESSTDINYSFDCQEVQSHDKDSSLIFQLNLIISGTVNY